ncbi:hypothetical protein VP01_2810g2 [Puccinia sorghi]|uniref:Uncharacterized protein n=1 Tax=Puccinia sorghi TaxID=27349 RepID=A0A0L6V2F6_9BASI|nr:hypothetical protein VP01_2810g2 [Puccinia sorghi]
MNWQKPLPPLNPTLTWIPLRWSLQQTDSSVSTKPYPWLSTKIRASWTMVLVTLSEGNTLESVREGYVQFLAGDGSTIQLKAPHFPQLAGTLVIFGRLFIQGFNLLRTGNSTFDMVKDGVTLLSTKVIDSTCKFKLVQSPQVKNHHTTTVKTVIFDGSGELNSKRIH